MCDKYQGYSNYPTWCYHLWLSNEQSSYVYWQERVQEVVHEARKVYNEADKIVNGAKYTIASLLRDAAKDADPLDGASVYSDLLSWALEHVDYCEIAEYLVNDWLECNPIPKQEEDESGDPSSV